MSKLITLSADQVYDLKVLLDEILTRTIFINFVAMAIIPEEVNPYIAAYVTHMGEQQELLESQLMQACFWRYPNERF